MITSKQRASLRALANTMAPITQIGKSGVSEEVCKSVDAALDSRELVKLSVLETAGVSAREAAVSVAEATGADIVAVIGRRFVLFRVSSKPENRKISAELKLK